MEYEIYKTLDDLEIEITQGRACKSSYSRVRELIRNILDYVEASEELCDTCGATIDGHLRSNASKCREL